MTTATRKGGRRLGVRVHNGKGVESCCGTNHTAQLVIVVVVGQNVGDDEDVHADCRAATHKNSERFPDCRQARGRKNKKKSR